MDGPRGQVLIVDDDPGVREPVCAWLAATGLSVLAAGRAEEALSILEGFAADALVLDLQLPDRDGVGLLRAVHARLPRLPVVVLTSHREAEVAVECMKAGAYDYLVKPVDEPRLVTTVANALRHRQLVETLAAVERTPVASAAGPEGAADGERLSRIAGGDLPVLVRGGTETDREFTARALHQASPRASSPFVAVRCGAVPPARLVSDLFGPGTDAQPAVQRASHGTLFLDGVEELQPPAQERLLEAATAAASARAGAGPGPELRVVIGTRVDLARRVREGTFRADLFMRLAVEELALGAPTSPRAASDSARIADRERDAVLEALTHSAGNRSEASRALGISRTTLYRKLKEYGIE